MRALIVCLVAAMTLALTASPAQAQFQQDPPATCFCPDDPFCTCNGDSTGGSTPSGSCQTCSYYNVDIGGTSIRVYYCTSATHPGIYKDDCGVQPDGSCELFGRNCTIILV